MGASPHQALERLRRASGALDDLCQRHAVRLLVAFGSATRPEAEPADLDIAVAFERGTSGDALSLLSDLVDLTESDRLDIMDLGSAGAVARERALVGCVPLFERQRGEFARSQMAAISESLDTAWLRQLELELLAEG
jgi:predicted nucleotidyltransferase